MNHFSSVGGQVLFDQKSAFALVIGLDLRIQQGHQSDCPCDPSTQKNAQSKHNAGMEPRPLPTLFQATDHQMPCDEGHFKHHAKNSTPCSIIMP